MTTINIEPLVIEKIGNITFTVVTADISVSQVELFSQARVSVSLKDSDGVVRANYDFDITGEEYNSWNEDTYIVELIKTKIGLVEVNEEEE